MVETPEPKVQLHSGPLPLKLKFNQPILKGGRSLDVIKTHRVAQILRRLVDL